MNPYKLVRREQGYEPTIGTPCVSESFFRHSYPIVHGNSLTLAQVVDVVHEDREAVLASTRLMKEKVAQTVKERRRDYERDSSRLDEMMPPEVDTLISVCRNYSPKDRYQQLGELESMRSHAVRTGTRAGRLRFLGRIVTCLKRNINNWICLKKNRKSFRQTECPGTPNSRGRCSEDLYCSRPNTPTPLVVPTYTLPFVIIGVMNLFPAPN